MERRCERDDGEVHVERREDPEHAAGIEQPDAQPARGLDLVRDKSRNEEPGHHKEEPDAKLSVIEDRSREERRHPSDPLKVRQNDERNRKPAKTVERGDVAIGGHANRSRRLQELLPPSNSARENVIVRPACQLRHDRFPTSSTDTSGTSTRPR